MPDNKSCCYFRFVVVQSAGRENSGEEGYSHDESTLHGSDGHNSSCSDSEEEEETQGIVTGINLKIPFYCFTVQCCILSTCHSLLE